MSQKAKSPSLVRLQRAEGTLMNVFINGSGDRSKRVAFLATVADCLVRQTWQIVAVFVLAAAMVLPTAFALTARASSADTQAAAGSKRAAAPASDDGAKDRGPSVAPKTHESSGKTSSPKSEGDKKPSEALTFTGRVTDRLTGKPIAGASVTVLRRVSSRVIRFSDWRNLGETKHQTDADGRFTFTISPEQAAEDRLYVSVTVTHPDYLREGTACYFERFRKHETFRQGRLFDKLTMEPAGEISGTVVTPDGKPAKGVPVRAVATPGKRNLNGMSWEDAATNEAGFFQLKVKKGGEAVLWIIPEDYSPSTHVLHAKRGDLGRFVLAKGLVLKGRVVDIDGKPLKNVWVNAELRGGPAKQRYEMPVFDYVARSALSDDQGEFSMAPLPAGDYDLIMADEPRHRGGKGVVHPLPAVFIDRTIKIDQDVSTRSIEIRAVPHVLIAGQFFDGSGKPTSGHAPELFARNAKDGIRAWFGDKARNDEQGKFSVRSPKGFTATLDIMDDDQHVLGIRTARNGPLRYGRELDLGMLQRDMTEVTVIRYVAPVLLVKAVGEDGQPVGEFQPRVTYRSPGVAEGYQFYREGKPNGYVGFTRQADGRQRSRQLLPDEEFTVTVEAEGFEPESEKLKLPEGTVKELEVRLKKTLKPGTSTKESSQTSPSSPPVQRDCPKRPCTMSNRRMVSHRGTEALRGGNPAIILSVVPRATRNRS